MNILLSKPIATFSVVRLSELGYGEIDPKFIVEYYNKLEQKWFISNPKCGWIDAKFNLSYENPTIFTGWKELIEYNNLPNNVEIEMEYHGRSNFAIKSFKEIKSAAEILPFHSRSLLPIHTFDFDVVLTETTVKKQNLTLPAAFGRYLSTKDYKWLILCGDHNRQELLKVIHQMNAIQLGNTWKDVCNENFFVAGDTIRFKFATNDPHHRCHMFKPTPFENASTS
ncbi:hypothetical protein QL285_063084 [Trifolium repens]|nr:hypothetical protein QL285_063084 [Trifolium repens]